MSRSTDPRAEIGASFSGRRLKIMTTRATSYRPAKAPSMSAIAGVSGATWLGAGAMCPSPVTILKGSDALTGGFIAGGPTGGTPRMA